MLVQKLKGVTNSPSVERQVQLTSLFVCLRKKRRLVTNINVHVALSFLSDASFLCYLEIT